MEQPLNGVSLPKYCFRYKFISMSNHCHVLIGSFFWRSSIAAKSGSSVFTLKTKHQMFSVHTTPENLKKASMTVIKVTPSFSKISVFKTFSVDTETKARIINSPEFEESSVFVTD